MDEHLYDDLIGDMRSISITVDGIKGTEKCFVRKAGMKYLVELHAIVNGKITVEEGHFLAHKLQEKIQDKLPEIAHMTIHIEPD